jgi:hypothetical protein
MTASRFLNITLLHNELLDRQKSIFLAKSLQLSLAFKGILP